MIALLFRVILIKLTITMRTEGDYNMQGGPSLYIVFRNQHVAIPFQFL